MPLLVDDFEPARGLLDANAQTVFAAFSRPKGPFLRRERLTTPDGDFVDVDLLDGRPGAPTVLLLHGLEGSSASGYVRVMMNGLAARGWSGVALNARSCSGEPNRQAASYSSGDYRDALWLSRRLPRPLYAVGFSLGGSVVLNLVAQRGAEARLDAAAAVSVPFDLDACARLIDSGRGFSRVYLNNFLFPMKQKALAKAERFPRALDARRIERVRTIREFDDAVTAPLFGFGAAEDYYARCSTGPQLPRITTPTLLVTAEDDPIAPAKHLPGDAHRHAALHVLASGAGGHVAFVAGSVLRPWFWSEQRVLSWLDEQYLSLRSGERPARSAG